MHLSLWYFGVTRPTSSIQVCHRLTSCFFLQSSFVWKRLWKRSAAVYNLSLSTQQSKLTKYQKRVLLNANRTINWTRRTSSNSVIYRDSFVPPLGTRFKSYVPLLPSTPRILIYRSGVSITSWTVNTTILKSEWVPTLWWKKQVNLNKGSTFFSKGLSKENFGGRFKGKGWVAMGYIRIANVKRPSC